MVRNGVNVTQMNLSGETALGLAFSKKSQELIGFLKKAAIPIELLNPTPRNKIRSDL